MKRQIINKIERVDFDSFDEFLQFMKDSKGKGAERNDGSEKYDFKDWYGTKTFDNAIEIAENGWSEGANLIKDVLDKIKFLGKATTFSPIYQVSGESVDVGRFLSGEPENMLEWELIETTGKKVVDIYFNVVASSGYSTTSLINYGSVCLSVVDYLESIGCRVNLYSYYSFAENTSGTNKRMIRVKIKNANDSLNIATCAFAIAHPSMMRRFMFKCCEVFDGFYFYGYGYVKEFEAKDIVLNNIKESCVFQAINNVGKFYDEQETVKYLKSRLPQTLNDLEISDKTKYLYK